MIVMKFGGTSVGDAECVANVARIINDHRQGGERIVVVASATAGVTNDIIRATRLAALRDVAGAQEVISSLRQRHHEPATLVFDRETERGDYEAFAERLFEDLADLPDNPSHQMLSSLAEFVVERRICAASPGGEPRD